MASTALTDQPTPAELEAILPKVDLIADDGEPLETSWHRDQINLLVDMVEWNKRGRTDFYCGGNMFIYFNLEQARNRDYRGPDFFYVEDVPHEPPRDSWVVWEEAGRYPDLIVELGSQSTIEEDRTVKKSIYERTFRTFEYVCYDPDVRRLEGWRLLNDRYQAIALDGHGRLECKKLGLWLGLWEGRYLNHEGVWLRFFDAAGNLVPTTAEAAQQKVNGLEEELAQARARLAALEGQAPAP